MIVEVEFCAFASVTLSVLVPPTRLASAARVGLGSFEARWTSSVVETGFQFASTEFTVTLNGVPEVCAVGEPVLPLAVPGAAVSPGRRICSFEAAAALTVRFELVFGLLAPLVASLAVIVAVPIAFRSVIVLKVTVPALSAASAGSVGFGSFETRCTVSVEVTGFQFASTALTTTPLKEVPAVCAVTAPLLPVAVPGAAVSPGRRICSFANGPRRR